MVVREKAGGFDRKPKLCSVDLVDLLLEDSVVWGVALVKVPKRFLDDLPELVEALLIHRRHGCARARFRAPRAFDLGKIRWGPIRPRGEGVGENEML